MKNVTKKQIIGLLVLLSITKTGFATFTCWNKEKYGTLCEDNSSYSENREITHKGNHYRSGKGGHRHREETEEQIEYSSPLQPRSNTTPTPLITGKGGHRHSQGRAKGGPRHRGKGGHQDEENSVRHRRDKGGHRDEGNPVNRRRGKGSHQNVVKIKCSICLEEHDETNMVTPSCPCKHKLCKTCHEKLCNPSETVQNESDTSFNHPQGVSYPNKPNNQEMAKIREYETATRQSHQQFEWKTINGYDYFLEDGKYWRYAQDRSMDDPMHWRYIDATVKCPMCRGEIGRVWV